MVSISRLLAALTLCVAAVPAQAALVARGGGMVYDTTHNITWIADAKLLVTIGWAHPWGNGWLQGFEAVDIADWLVYGGFDDWRLPTVKPNDIDTTCTFNVDVITGYVYKDAGWRCSGGELSHLVYVDLGAPSGNLYLTAQQIANRALFSNLPTNQFIWSGTAHADEMSYAVDFGRNLQSIEHIAMSYQVLFVRDGDVAASDVPEPQTLALALLALGAAGAVARRRRQA